MKLIRWIVGKILLFINLVTYPKAGHRTPENQLKIKKALNGYSLYEFNACPFCVKVRRAMQRLNLPIERRDASKNEHHKNELAMQGGKVKVPCLRYPGTDGKDLWMYESNDIIDFLEERFPLDSIS